MLKGNFRKAATAILAIAVSASVLAGCGQSNGSTGSSAASEESQSSSSGMGTEAAKSSKDTLIIALQGDFKAMGYAQNGRMLSSIAAPTLFDCVETDAGNYEYAVDDKTVVESYEWNDDNTAITLHLKSGVAMHDGTTLDSEDIKTSLQVYADNNSVSSNNIIFDEISCDDDLTVTVPFSSAKVSNWIDLGSRMVFSKEAYESVGDYDLFTQSSDFAGYGPYKVTEWASGDSVTFEKFEGYFGTNDTPINKIVVRRIDEANIAMMELQTGGVDMVVYPAESDIKDVENGTYDNIAAISCPGLYQQIVWFNLAEGSRCADERVRQALCYAIDRGAMWSSAFESSGLLANTCGSSTLEFMDPIDDPYPQNPEKAKELLTEAGYGDGMNLVVCVDNDSYRSSAVEMFKNNVADLGITVDIHTGDNATYLGEVTGTTDWDLEFGKAGNLGSIAWWLDTQWDVFSHGNVAAEDFSDYYALRDEILAEFDDDKRDELTQDFVRQFYEKWTFFYPIRQDVYYTLINNKLNGFDRVGEQLNVTNMYFAE